MRKPAQSLCPVPLRFVLPLLVLLALLCTPAAARAGPPDDPTAGNAAAPRIVLNEVMPKPDGSGVEWIELYYLDPAVTLQYQFFPTISKLGITAAQSSTLRPGRARDCRRRGRRYLRLAARGRRPVSSTPSPTRCPLSRPATSSSSILMAWAPRPTTMASPRARPCCTRPPAWSTCSMTARTRSRSMRAARTRPPRCATSSPGAARRSMPAMPWPRACGMPAPISNSPRPAAMSPHPTTACTCCPTSPPAATPASETPGPSTAAAN